MTDDRTCRHTPHVMADYLGSQPGSTASREAACHIAECPDCQAELAGLEPVITRLRQWREQSVPAWNRRPQGRRPFWRSRWLFWQWIPLAASIVLVLGVIFNVQVSVNESGWQISFGRASVPSDGGLMGRESPQQAADDPVQRPGREAMRQSMALSLETAESLRSPGEIDGSQSEQWRDEVAAFERQLYDVICRHGASVQEPGGEGMTVVLSGLAEIPAEGGRAGGRVHVVGGAALQACQRGDLDAAGLMEGADSYSF